MGKHRQKQAVCPNCGYEMGKTVNFCPQCGQENHVKIQSLKTIFGDWMEAFLSFDTRLIRSLQVIMTSPGKITRLFLAGKHVSYVSPLRLYLFSSVLMFFMLNQYIKHHKIGEYDREAVLSDSANVQFQIGFEASSFEMTPRQFADLYKVSNAQLDSVFLANGRGDPSLWEKAFIRQAAKMLQEGQGQYLLEVVRNTSISMFVLMPLFGVFLWLFYRQKLPFYVSHLVFSFHYHAVFFLFLTIGFALDIGLGWENLSWLFLGALVYQVIALRNTYQYTWGKTLLRFFGVNFLYLLTLIFVVVAVSVVSLLTF